MPDRNRLCSNRLISFINSARLVLGLEYLGHRPVVRITVGNIEPEKISLHIARINIVRGTITININRTGLTQPIG